MITGVAVTIAGLLIAVPSAKAFWPFDGLFNKGEVKSMVVDKGIPDYKRTPIRSTTAEVKALAEACRNIVTLKNVQQSPPVAPEELKKQNQARQTIEEKYQIVERDVVLDKVSMKNFTSIQRLLVVKCNEILKLTTKMNPITVMVERETPNEKEISGDDMQKKVVTPIRVKVPPSRTTL